MDSRPIVLAGAALLLLGSAPVSGAKIRCVSDAEMVENVRAVQSGQKPGKRKWGSVAPIFCVVTSAALSADQKMIAARALVEIGSDLAFRTANGRTALHQVAISGPPELARFLIEHGADPDAIDLSGVSPQQLAMKSGDPALVEVFAATSRYVDNRDNNGVTSLYEAASRGDLAVVRALISRGADAGLSDKNALTGAAIGGHEAVVRYLLDDVRLPVDVRSSDGETALMGAAAANKVGVAQLLVEEYRANPELVSPRGFTALSLAATAGHLDMIRYLHSRGATDGASTPAALATAALARQPEASRLLIELGADIGAGTMARPGVLYWAGVSGDADVLRTLTDHGAAFPDFPADTGPVVHALVNHYYGRGLLAKDQYQAALPYLRNALDGYNSIDSSLSDRIAQLRKTASRETLKANLAVGFAIAFGAFAAQYQANQYKDSMAQIQAMSYSNRAGTGVTGYYQYYDTIMRSSTAIVTVMTPPGGGATTSEAAAGASADVYGQNPGWRGRAALARSEIDSLRDLVEQYREDAKIAAATLACAEAAAAPNASAPTSHCL